MGLFSSIVFGFGIVNIYIKLVGGGAGGRKNKKIEKRFASQKKVLIFAARLRKTDSSLTSLRKITR
jgi:hypothetical protein